MFWMVSAFILVAYQVSFAQEKLPIGTTTLKTNATLFDSPGFDRYDQPGSAEAKAAWPRAGTVLTILDSKLENNRRYYQVTFPGDATPEKHKWISMTNEALGPVRFRTPELEAEYRSYLTLDAQRAVPEQPPVRPATPPTSSTSQPPGNTTLGGVSNTTLSGSTSTLSGNSLRAEGPTLREGFRDLSQSTSSGGLHTLDQIGDYMSGVDHYETYQTTYKPLVSKSASHFGISETFMTCLLYQESKWKINAKSDAGAEGLAQLTSPNVAFINNNIGARFSLFHMPRGWVDTPTGPCMKRETPEKCAERGPSPYCSPRDSREVCEQRALRRWQYILDNPGKFSKKDQGFARTKHEMYTVREMWKSYWVAQNKPAPRSLNIYNPEQAIAVSGLYLRFSINSALRYMPDRRWDDADSLTSQDVFDFHLALGAGYNAGHGVFGRKIRDVNPPSAAGWKKAMETANPRREKGSKDQRTESQKHMDSIATCMGNPSTSARQQGGNRNSTGSRGDL